MPPPDIPALLLFAQLLLLVAGRFADKQADCQANEQFIQCGTCEGSCKEPIVLKCRKECKPPRCECQAKQGFVRAHDGACIRASQCQTYKGIYGSGGIGGGQTMTGQNSPRGVSNNPNALPSRGGSDSDTENEPRDSPAMPPAIGTRQPIVQPTATRVPSPPSIAPPSFTGHRRGNNANVPEDQVVPSGAADGSPPVIFRHREPQKPSQMNLFADLADTQMGAQKNGGQMGQAQQPEEVDGDVVANNWGNPPSSFPSTAPSPAVDGGQQLPKVASLPHGRPQHAPSPSLRPPPPVAPPKTPEYSVTPIGQYSNSIVSGAAHSLPQPSRPAVPPQTSDSFMDENDQQQESGVPAENNQPSSNAAQLGTLVLPVVPNQAAQDDPEAAKCATRGGCKSRGNALGGNTPSVGPEALASDANRRAGRLLRTKSQPYLYAYINPPVDQVQKASRVAMFDAPRLQTEQAQMASDISQPRPNIDDTQSPDNSADANSGAEPAQSNELSRDQREQPSIPPLPANLRIYRQRLFRQRIRRK